jgi:flagellar hook-associated protein 3 FlgL
LRISNQAILTRATDTIEQSLADIGRLEQQVTTGRRFERASEDPMASRSVMALDAQLRTSEQYRKNITVARGRLTMEEGALESLSNLIGRAREIASQQGSGSATLGSQAAGVGEVQGLRDSVIALANLNLTGVFIFGGVHADRAPLDDAGALDGTLPARGTHQYQVSLGNPVDGTHDAGEAFIDSGVIQAFDDLEAAIAAGDSAPIIAQMDQLTQVLENVQQLVVDVGNRQVRLNVADDAINVSDEAMLERRSLLADASLPEAIASLVNRQASYQASLLATSRILQTSLVNYL